LTPAKTAADYAAIAVAPLLIFLMISSLANFLMLVFYHGGFPQRVSWTLLMFTLGAVGVARIAIEQDRPYALGYAGILGLVTFVAMLRFVDSPLFSAAILVVIAYLADVIVRDCTLIDDKVDASGQGLIDSGRLFMKQQIQPDDASAEEGNDLSGQPPARRKTHQPGRTVMWLALAALPMFGIGQFLLRDDPDTSTRAQKLLAFYLFASLSLLVTTSFLGLRRYLRQRQVEMPNDVSIAWLAGGLAMIAAVLLVAYLAPLPGKAIASLELPELLDSPGTTKASRYGWGKEGADQSNRDAPSVLEPNSEDKEVQKFAPQQGAPEGDVGDGNREQGPTGKRDGGKQQAKGGGDQSQQQSDSSSQSGSQGENQQGQQSPSDASGEQSQQKSQQSSEQQSEAQQEERGESGLPPESGQASESSSSTPGVIESLADAVPMAVSLIKAFIFLVLAGIVLAFLWMHRHLIAQWWNKLFGGGRQEESVESFDDFVESVTQVPPRAFASFANPIGKESDPRRVVVITFQAFDAWTREQGTPRGKNETPTEFARRITQSVPQMSTPASQIVDAYNRIAYGRGAVTKDDLSAAERVWQLMTSG
jgi:hypothetical protein